MTMPESPQMEPCSAEYAATLVPVPDGNPTVFILAQGVHPTSGYVVIFHRSPKDIYPPEFSLWHMKPNGTALDVLTPFAEFTSFELHGDVQKVKIVDANGEQVVPVRTIAGALLHK